MKVVSLSYCRTREGDLKLQHLSEAQKKGGAGLRRTNQYTRAYDTRFLLGAWEHHTALQKQHVSTRQTELVKRATWYPPIGRRHRFHPSRRNHHPTTHILLLAGFTLSILSHSLSLLSLTQMEHLQREKLRVGFFGSVATTGNKIPFSQFHSQQLRSQLFQHFIFNFSAFFFLPSLIFGNCLYGCQLCC